VTDYRKLNEILLTKDYTPIRLLQDLFSRLSGATIFSQLDLSQAFFQCPLPEKDKQYTAMIYSEGIVQYERLPMGIQVAPFTLCTLLRVVFEDMLYKYLLSYVDDLTIFSRTFSDHVEHDTALFRRLRASSLMIKPSKSALGFAELKILGFIVSAKGILPDPGKLRCVQDMPRPSTVKAVQSFTALCSWFRRFIPSFSNIAAPLVQLTKKGHKFVWTEDCEKAFIKLKEALVNPPILAMVDINKPVHVFADASNDCIGGVLMQEYPEGKRVVEYASQSLRGFQRNWAISKKEAYSLLWCLKKWRIYIYGRNDFTCWS
jgi:hypothetical protein